MAESNNRGTMTPPVGGTESPAQASSTIHVIDTSMYGKEFNPRGYSRVCVLKPKDEIVAPLESNVNDSAAKY